MKKLLLLFFILSVYHSFAQQTILGVVVNEFGQPIPFVSISQVGSKTYHTSSSDGSFHITIQPQYSNKINFNHHKHQPKVVNLTTSMDSTLQVVLNKQINQNRFNSRPPRKRKAGSKQWHLGFSIDWMSTDFNVFQNLLVEENIDRLNKHDLTFGVELGFTNKRFYHGYNLGFSAITNNQNDTIVRVVNKSFVGAQIGYKLLDSKRWSFMPTIGIKKYKYRLTNHDKEAKISLNQFLTQRRDLDIRFNQFVGYLGGNLSFKLKPKNRDPNNTGFWSFGIYGGYLFKIHPRPLVYAKSNRLTTDQKTSIENFNIGIHFTGNINSNSQPYKPQYQ